MNPHFGNTFTHRLVVTEISFLRTVNTRLDPTGDLFVSQGVKPSVKNFGRIDRLHGALYQLGYENVNPMQPVFTQHTRGERLECSGCCRS